MDKEKNEILFFAISIVIAIIVSIITTLLVAGNKSCCDIRDNNWNNNVAIKK